MDNTVTDEEIKLQPILSTEEKNTLVLIAIFSIFLTFIHSLIIYFKWKKFTPYAREIFMKIFNFELILGLTMFGLNFIPLIGQVTIFILIIYNAILCIKAVKAINADEKIEYPIKYQLLK